MISVNLGIFVH